MSPLIALAEQIGAPMVRDMLARKIGAGNAYLAEQVVGAVARRLNVPIDQIEAEIANNQPRVIDAIRQVELMSPELVALYTAGVERQFAAMAAEKDEPLWMRAWRPGGMYMIAFLWLWNAVILHCANAYWKIALPPIPWDVLLAVTGLYMGLYMGGHTVKNVAAKWLGAKPGASA